MTNQLKIWQNESKIVYAQLTQKERKRGMLFKSTACMIWYMVDEKCVSQFYQDYFKETSYGGNKIDTLVKTE